MIVHGISVLIMYLSLYYPMPVASFCSTEFAGDPDYPYQYYQSKTLYENSDIGDIRLHPRPPGCQPLAIVMLARHGARHSGDGDDDKFELLEKLSAKINQTGNAEMCSEDLKKIKGWKNWYDPNRNKDLAVTGINEMDGLGQRFSESFPEIFSSYKNYSYRFISSDTQRTRESASVFMQSAYDMSNPVEIDDRLIHAYDYCERYVREVDDNDTVTIEKEKFAAGDVIATITSRVAKRLGIHEKDIDNDAVDIMRKEGCAEEEWSLGNNSVWCLAFTKEDLLAFEYKEDLDDYVTQSYGVEISYKSSCLVKSHLLAALYNISQGDYQSQYLFGHTQTLMSTLTDMKLIEDDGPFLSKDYSKHVNRKFRGSNYTPSSGNIAFVVYDCNGEMKLQAFQNEKPMSLPLEDPHDGELWDLSEALSYFKANTSECRWTEYCSLEYEATPAPTDEDSYSFWTSTVTGLSVVMLLVIAVIVVQRKLIA